MWSHISDVIWYFLFSCTDDARGVAHSVGVAVLQVPEEAGGAGAARGTSERREEEVPAGRGRGAPQERDAASQI